MSDQPKHQLPLVVRIPRPAKKSAAEVLEQEYAPPSDLEAILGFKPWSNRHRRVLEAKGKFPARVYLSDRRVVYRVADLIGWVANRNREQGIRRNPKTPSRATVENGKSARHKEPGGPPRAA